MYVYAPWQSLCILRSTQPPSGDFLRTLWASFKGRRAFRRIPVPARPHDGRFGGWAGQFNDFSAGHLNQINDIKSSSTILNLIQISFEYGWLSWR